MSAQVYEVVCVDAVPAKLEMAAKKTNEATVHMELLSYCDEAMDPAPI